MQELWIVDQELLEHVRRQHGVARAAQDGMCLVKGHAALDVCSFCELSHVRTVMGDAG